MSNNLICFGDVVKLSTKSAFAPDDAAEACVGFLEQKSELLLVVAPVKDEAADKFHEAEFLVAPVRGDKPPPKGTPLKYAQAFVLKTSDGAHGYSLNNKTPGMTEVVSLRETRAEGVKGEMYLAFQKENFGPETDVHDGDVNVELKVVDSNRIRKTYDGRPLAHVAKAKSDAPGGFVSCGAKGKVLTFKVVKVAEKSATPLYVKNAPAKRLSQLQSEPAKADETSEASVIESPSRAGSIVATSGPLATDELATPPSSPKSAAQEPEMAEPPAVAAAAVEAATTVEPAAASAVTQKVETAKTTEAVVVVDATAGGAVSPVDLLAVQLQSVAAAAAEIMVATTTVADKMRETAPPIVGGELLSALATIELSGASITDPDAMDGSAPVHDKMASGMANDAAARAQAAATTMTTTPTTAPTPTTATATAKPATQQQQPAKAAAKPATTATETSEENTLQSIQEEHVDTACVGKCAIM